MLLLTNNAFYEVFECKDGLFRWRLKGGNGEIMIQGEGHPNRQGCRDAIERIKRAAATTDIRDI